MSFIDILRFKLPTKCKDVVKLVFMGLSRELFRLARAESPLFEAFEAVKAETHTRSARFFTLDEFELRTNH